MQAIRDVRYDLNKGQRRNRPELAPYFLDLTWAKARADSGSTAHSRDYPSPPMSGSPSLPPKAPQEFAERSQGGLQGGLGGQAGQGSYQATTAHDVRHEIPAIQSDARQQQQGGIVGRPGRLSYSAEAHERMQHAWPRPEPSLPRALPYPYQGQAHAQGQSQGLGQVLHQHQHQHQQQHQHHHRQQQQHHHLQHHHQPQQLSYLPAPALGPGPSLAIGSAPPTVYPGPLSKTMTAAPPRPALEQQREGPINSSPKLQRKTKGHVASACVPCKRAHLRCDAQRPCSRCTSNGKEDACVDVQHKKRGRPRLRDDREARYDPRFGGYSDNTTPIMRRPMSLSGYSSGPSAGAAFDDSVRRNQAQSYRVLKSQPPEPIAPRFIERASVADANIFPPPPPMPLSIYTKPPEPAAFLTTDLEIAKVSNTFLDALARLNIKGMKLVDVVAPSDREKVNDHQRQLQEEQRRRDPTYLPPIFGKQEEDRVIQALGFGADEVARYPLDREDFLTFITQEGQQRAYPVRIGLAKQDSIYFVVVRLWMAMRGGFPPPTPSPNPRDIVTPSPFYQAMPQPYSQPTPVSASFDPRQQQRLGDFGGYGPRQTAQHAPIMQGLSPGVRPSYAPSPNRPDFQAGQPSYEAPRNELMPATSSATARPPSIPGYHLPPILGQQQSTPLEPQHSYLSSEHAYQQRDDHRRVGIGGLIDQPDPSSRARS